MTDQVENHEIDENAASDSVKMTKVDIIGQVVKAMNGMTINDLSKWHEDSINNYKSFAANIPDGTSAKNKSSIEMKGDAKKAVAEEAQALFQEIPEDFRVKALTLFESAVATRVAVELAEQVAELEEQFEEALDEIHEELAERTQAYLEQVAESWLEQNQVAVESSIRSEHTENLVQALRGVLADHYVELPEEKVDVLDEVVAAAEDLEERLNEALEDCVELATELKKRDALAVFERVAEGLALTDKERFKQLAEDVDVDDDLEEKLVTIREANFKKDGKPASVVGREVLGEETVVVLNDATATETETKPVATAEMAPYMDALSRLIR